MGNVRGSVLLKMKQYYLSNDTMWKGIVIQKKTIGYCYKNTTIGYCYTDTTIGYCNTKREQEGQVYLRYLYRTKYFIPYVLRLHLIGFLFH